MSKLEYTRPLMNKLTNIYKSGGVKRALSDSCCDDLNPSTHTCRRLLMHFVSKVAFVVSILFLTGACQQARLIPDEETKEATRGTEAAIEEKKDSTNVDINFDAEGWEGSVDAEFEFGGEEKEEE